MIIEPNVKVYNGTSKGVGSVNALKLKTGFVLIVDENNNVLDVKYIPGSILVSDDGTVLVDDYNYSSGNNTDIPYASKTEAGVVKIGDGLYINSETGVLKTYGVLELVTNSIQTINGPIIFKKSPQSNSLPVNNSDLVNKSYVDDKLSKKQDNITPIDALYFNRTTDQLQLKLKINSGDKVLSQNNNGLLINLKLIYDKDTSKIKLIGDSNKLVSEIDIKDFSLDAIQIAINNTNLANLIPADTSSNNKLVNNNYLIDKLSKKQNNITPVNSLKWNPNDSSQLILEINSSDKVLSQSPNGLLTNLSLLYVTGESKLKLLGLNNNIISEINSKDLLIDSNKVLFNNTNLGSIIPVDTTSENNLVNKDYVISAIRSNSAYFRGNYPNWQSVPSDANNYPIDPTGNRIPLNNDYMVVQDASDYSDNNSSISGTWRFKYSGIWSEVGKSGWTCEYQINESPMTQDQLDALNSGINVSKVNKLNNIENNAQVNIIDNIVINGSTGQISNKLTKVNLDNLIADHNREVYKVTLSDNIEFIQSNLKTDLFNNIFYVNYIYFAVCRYGLYYSIDSINWTKVSNINSGGYDDKVIYFKDRYIYLTDDKWYYSTDGITWNIINYPILFSGYVAYNDSVCLVSEIGSYYYSTNGVDWIRYNRPNHLFVNIFYFRGKFISTSVYSSSGSYGICYSINGIDWISTNLESGGVSSYAINYGNDLCVVTVHSLDNKSEVYYSTNGLEWILSKSSSIPYSVVYYGDKFLLYSEDDDVGIMYSIDGKNWIQSDLRSGEIQYICYGTGLYLVLDYNGHLYRSFNGINWEEKSTDQDISNLTYCKDRFYAGVDTGIWYYSPKILEPLATKDYVNNSLSNKLENIVINESTGQIDNKVAKVTIDNLIADDNNEVYGIYYLPDLNTWNRVSNIPGNSIIFSDKYILGSDNNGIYYSIDGITWNQSNQTTGYWNEFVYGNGKYIAGGPYILGIYYSIDGITWTQSNQTTDNWLKFIYGNGKYIAGSNNGIYYSTDGITWNPTNQTTGSWSAFVYGNGKYIAGSNNGIYYSTDGITWNPTNQTTGKWSKIIYGDGMYLAANSQFPSSLGILYSDDGITWSHSEKDIYLCTGLVYGNNKFIIINVASIYMSGKNYVNKKSLATNESVNNILGNINSLLEEI